MARFKYNGEPARPKLVVAYGPTLKIIFRLKDGTKTVLTPVPPATQFVIGDDIGYDITDARVIRHMEADPRFTRLS